MYVPPGKADQELYKWLVELGDMVFGNLGVGLGVGLGRLAGELGVSGDAEAVNAWFNLYIRPYVGSYEALKTVLEFGGSGVDVVEWEPGWSGVGDVWRGDRYRFRVEF